MDVVELINMWSIRRVKATSPQLARLVEEAASVSFAEDLLEAALEEGMSTLKQDGIQKVFSGITDINEIRRVCID